MLRNSRSAPPPAYVRHPSFGELLLQAMNTGALCVLSMGVYCAPVGL